MTERCFRRIRCAASLTDLQDPDAVRQLSRSAVAGETQRRIKNTTGYQFNFLVCIFFFPYNLLSMFSFRRTGSSRRMDTTRTTVVESAISR